MRHDSAIEQSETFIYLLVYLFIHLFRIIFLNFIFIYLFTYLCSLFFLLLFFNGTPEDTLFRYLHNWATAVNMHTTHETESNEKDDERTGYGEDGFGRGADVDVDEAPGPRPPVSNLEALGQTPVEPGLPRHRDGVMGRVYKLDVVRRIGGTCNESTFIHLTTHSTHFWYYLTIQFWEQDMAPW